MMFVFVLVSCIVGAALASHVSPTGKGTKDEPYKVPPGETESLALAKGATTYFLFNTTGASSFEFVLYPCFGAMDHSLFLNTKDVSAKPHFKKTFPTDPSASHGNHIWDPVVVLDLAGAEFVFVEVVNTFDGESSFTLDNRVDDTLWLAPGDGEITVGEVTATTAALSWQATGTSSDEYKVVYHIGGDNGKMEPGNLMGTACAIAKLQMLHGSDAHVTDADDADHSDHDHDHDDHQHKRDVLEGDEHDHDDAGTHAEHGHIVVTAFDWTAAKTEHVLDGLTPNTNAYHVEVLVRRMAGQGHYHIVGYHSQIVVTKEAEPDNAAGSFVVSYVSLGVSALLSLRWF